MAPEPRQLRVAVAVVGAGPAGIGAALGLVKAGVRDVLLLERQEELGGLPALCRDVPGALASFQRRGRARPVHGTQLLKPWLRALQRSRVQVRTRCQVLEIQPRSMSLTVMSAREGWVRIQARAVILACGARERTRAERGWLHGGRPAGVGFSRHLLQLQADGRPLPGGRVILAGSDEVARASAVRLRRAEQVVLADEVQRPRCGWAARVFFRRWGKADWRLGLGTAQVEGTDGVQGLRPEGAAEIPCDQLLLAGDLVPCSELASLGGLEVEPASREPVVSAGHRLSMQGWYVTGNLLGGAEAAEHCHRDGLGVGREVGRSVGR